MMTEWNIPAHTLWDGPSEWQLEDQFQGAEAQLSLPTFSKNQPFKPENGSEKKNS